MKLKKFHIFVAVFVIAVALFVWGIAIERFEPMILGLVLLIPLFALRRKVIHRPPREDPPRQPPRRSNP